MSPVQNQNKGIQRKLSFWSEGEIFIKTVPF